MMAFEYNQIMRTEIVLFVGCRVVLHRPWAKNEIRLLFPADRVKLCTAMVERYWHNDGLAMPLLQDLTLWQWRQKPSRHAVQQSISAVANRPNLISVDLYRPYRTVSKMVAGVGGPGEDWEVRRGAHPERNRPGIYPHPSSTTGSANSSGGYGGYSTVRLMLVR